MTINTEALASLLYNPILSGLVHDIYKRYEPITPDILEAYLKVLDLTAYPDAFIYDGVILNPRKLEIEYIYTLLENLDFNTTELDKILQKYYKETDFTCNEDVSGQCECPPGMTKVDYMCHGIVDVLPKATYFYNSTVWVTYDDWHPKLNESAIWVSVDGERPQVILGLEVGIAFKLIIPVPGDYVFEGSGDATMRCLLDGQEIFGTPHDEQYTVHHRNWYSNNFHFNAGEYLIELKCYNETYARDFRVNPAGFGLIIKGPDGSEVFHTRKSHFRIVPFWCPDGCVPDLNRNICAKLGSVHCSVPATHPDPSDFTEGWRKMSFGFKKEEVEELKKVLKKLKDWTDRLLKDWVLFIATATNDMGVRTHVHELENPCDTCPEYLGSIKQEGQEDLQRIAEILAGFKDVMGQIKSIVERAEKGISTPPQPVLPECSIYTQAVNFNTGWSFNGPTLYYHDNQASREDLMNGTIRFTEPDLYWSESEYLKANPDVKEGIEKGIITISPSDHYIMFGAAEGRCVKAVCPYVLGPGILTPYFEKLKRMNGAELMKEVKALDKRINDEKVILAKSQIRMLRMAGANKVNNLPSDPCMRVLIDQIISPGVRALLNNSTQKTRRTQDGPIKPPNLTPYMAEPEWP